jgi:hypothetical protein
MFTSIPEVEAASSTRADVDAAIAESAIGSKNATAKRSTRYAPAVAAGVVLFGLLSPAKATAQEDRISALTDLSVGATATVVTPARNRAMALTSHLPWLAPVGHRQPRRVDVPQDESLLAGEREQPRLHKELDRKLIICSNCGVQR